MYYYYYYYYIILYYIILLLLLLVTSEKRTLRVRRALRARLSALFIALTFENYERCFLKIMNDVFL